MKRPDRPFDVCRTRTVTSFAVAILLVVAATPSLAHAQIFEIAPPPADYTWFGWEDLGGSTRTAPTCLSSDPHRIDCFVVLTDNALWRRWFDGTAWRWEKAAGLTVKTSYITTHSCVSWGPGRVDCFVRDHNDAMFHRWWDDGASDGWWEDLGGPLDSNPACVSTAPRRIDCFARFPDGTMRQRSFNGLIWGPWENRGGQMIERTKPACVAHSGGRIDCVVTWSDSELWHNAFDGGWSGWTRMPGGTVTLNSTEYPSPKCLVMWDAEIRCFAPTFSTSSGMTLSFWRKLPDRSTWSIGTLDSRLGGFLYYDFDCVARGGDRVDCMEVVGRAPSTFGGRATTQFRHFSWGLGATNTWRTVASLTGAPLPGDTYGLSCLKWGGDRVDCFASAGWLSSSPLFHAWNVWYDPTPSVWRFPR